MKLLYKVILVCFIAGLASGCGGSNGTLEIGSVASDFQLDTLAHGRFYLNQQKGKVVVLVFWDTTCVFCKSELVALKSFVDIPGASSLTVASVCIDPENNNDVKEIVNNLGLGYQVLLDRDAKVANKYKIMGIPETVIIDKTGRISFLRMGYDSVIMEQIRDKVVSLLAQEESNK